jgi:hypothetical protein
VRAEKIQPSPDSPGKVLYKVDDISFLMRAPAPVLNRSGHILDGPGLKAIYSEGQTLSGKCIA